MSNISREFFINNRQKLQASIDVEAPIVLSANGVLQRNNDVTYTFRQDSNFWYLTGLTMPDYVLVIKGGEEFLIIPKREEVIKKFDGDDDFSQIKKTSGIKNIFEADEGWHKLDKIISKNNIVATTLPPPGYIERLGIYTNPARQRLHEKLNDIMPNLKINDIRSNFARLRAIKQPVEVELIQEAIDLTGKAIEKIRKYRQKYRYEYEIEADISWQFKAAGCDHAFSPIVASGKSACTIHHISNNNPVTKDDLLVLDIGAEINHYAADITRTIAIHNASSRQQDIYKAVKDVQLYAMSLLKPGVLMRDFESSVEKYMGNRLIELKLINLNNKENVRKYFPHATSHFLGLDTHDVGEYDKPLAYNMVVTCEPGIYIPDEGIGVRIEDDVLITEDGNINLSENIPAGL